VSLAIAGAVGTLFTGGASIAAVVGGSMIALHGLDVTVSGIREIWDGQAHDTLTSTGLQALGVSQDVANWIDTGISIFGSIGVGIAFKFAGNAGKATSIFKGGANASERAMPKALGACFTAGTLVLTNHDRKPIEQVSIGQRVIVDPPESIQRSIDSQHSIENRDPSTLRVLRLEYTNPETNAVLSMAFLRSVEEVDALQPGDMTPIVLEEMDVEGQAKVIAIEPCPAIEDGEGELVTATFTQNASDIRLLHIAGLDKPIEVTGSHPIFSEDRKDFIPVRDLLPGERLRTRDGTAMIERIDRKPGSWQVFNLEIGTIHRYYVSELDVLVHNTCMLHGNSLQTTRTTMGYSLRSIKPGNFGEVLKYGQTTRGFARYSNAYLDRIGAKMVREATGSKVQMRAWETQKIMDFERRYGRLPLLNKGYH
ncbi:MAG: hypothetical protein FWD53_05060, partial [Phycisphaerales bacterium]|nr:hypothetical protein [Phycisphaerales bacterium]